MTNFYRVVKTELLLSNKQPTPAQAPPPGINSRYLIENLRTSFSIQKTNSLSTNTCSLRIWNLSADHRNAINTYGDIISVYAGYQSQENFPAAYTGSTANTSLLFIGNTTNVRHSFDYPDIITIFEAGDGDLQVNNTTIEQSYGPGTQARDILVNLVSSIGLDKIDPIQLKQIPDLEYKTGYSYAGSAKDSLEKICKFLGVQWSVQNGKMRIIPINGIKNTIPFVVNADTGMIGIPERYSYKRLQSYVDGPKAGWRVRSTLRTDIIAGNQILLSSTHLNLSPTLCLVQTIRHEGDTYGPQWYSNIEVTDIA